MVKLDRICREANVMLVFARSYGLTGFVRISVKAYSIANNPHYWQLHENIVSLLHVPLLVSDSSFSCNFYLHLSRSISHHISSFATALERKTTF
ncbi:hypothetical protein ACSBR2_002545 [Camellia fascicularis]